MLRDGVLCLLLLAASIGIGAASPAVAQMYPPDDDYAVQYPPAPLHHGRHARPVDVDAGAPPLPVPRGGWYPSPRDIEAAYPPSGADEYGDPSAPTPVDHSLRRGAGGGAASDRMLEEDSGQSTKAVVEYSSTQTPGTIVIDTSRRKLFVVAGGGRAIAYGIGVGREGFAWKGLARVGRKSVWPAWIPPADMLRRRPELPTRMEGGIDNPLGARALYLFRGNADTLFRIHGTNEPDSIGKAVSSGCIRMLNTDVIDLYTRIPIGTRVVVL